MTRHVVMFIVFTFALCLGCQQSSLSNWGKVRQGMTKGGVMVLLGEPSIKSDSSVSSATEFSETDPTLTEVAAAGIGASLFGDSREYWEYPVGKVDDQGDSDSENLISAIFGPSDDSYVVFFGSDGLVEEFRRPKVPLEGE